MILKPYNPHISLDLKEADVELHVGPENTHEWVELFSNTHVSRYSVRLSKRGVPRLQLESRERRK